MEIPELLNNRESAEIRYEAVSKHCFESPGDRPNEILQVQNAGASNVTLEKTSMEHSFVGTCAPDQQRYISHLDGELGSSQQQHQTALHDEVSSIFSDQESDTREREILQEALLHLKKENPFGFAADTCSDISEDLSENDRLRESCFSRPETQTTQKNAVESNANEKPPNETQLGKAELLGQTHCPVSVKTEHQNQLEHILRRTLQSPILERDVRKQERLSNGVLRMENGFSGNDSSDSGYISDIAVLARENEKLSEIIDHLHIQATSCAHEEDNDFLLDTYVAKEEYDRVESERFELENTLREKERRIREQVRTMEEGKYEHEEECRILNTSLAKAERKAQKNAKEIRNWEAKMKDATAKHLKQLQNLQRELENTQEESFKLQETILVLQKHNADFENELKGMERHIVKLEAQEEQLEERHRRDIGYLEERLEMESQEKNKQKQNAEALQQELLQTNTSLLQERGKHVAYESLEMTESKLKTENETGSHPITKSASYIKEVGTDVLEETAESETTPESTGHEDIKRRIQEEQQRTMKLEEDNEAMTKAINGLLSGDYSLLQSLLSDHTFSKIDLKSIQKKLSDTLKELKEVQLKNEEMEEDFDHLKRKSERLEREVTVMRETEDKNEELHVELERANRRLHELQRAGENTREEMEEMTETMRKLKDDNLAYKDETENLKVTITYTEEMLAKTNTQVEISLEEEKMAALHELKTKQEHTDKRNKRLESENDNLRHDLHKTGETIRALEGKFSAESSELTATHTKEMKDMKQRYALKDEELNTTAKMVREVTEEWETMLRKSVIRNEEVLQSLGEEKRQIQEELRRKTQEMDRQLEMCKCKAGQPSNDKEETHPSDLRDERYFKSRLQQKQNEGTTKMGDNFQTERRELAISLHGADQHTKGEGAEQIQELALRHELEIKELQETLNNEHKEAQERLRMELTRGHLVKSSILESRIESLILQKVQEERHRCRGLVVQHEQEKEKYITAIRRLKEKIHMNETERREMRRSLEEEKEKLEVTVTRLKNEMRTSKEEANEKRERDVTKVEEAFEKEKHELQKISEKRIERTKQKMEEEYEKKNEEVNERRERDAKKVEEALEKEIHELQKDSEKRKQKMEKDYERKATNERHKYEMDIQQLTEALVLLKEQMEEEIQCEECLKRDKSGSPCATEDESETKGNHEQDYERKLLKEKDNISSAWETLRREIKQLKAHREQLELYDIRENKNKVAQHSYPIKVNTPGVLMGRGNEFLQQVQHEKGVLKGRARELEREVERLQEKLSQQENRSRREQVQMKRRFQSEKDEMTEEFHRETYGWRAQMSLVAAKRNTMKEIQAAFVGGRIATRRNTDVFLRSHLTRPLVMNGRSSQFHEKLKTYNADFP